MSHLQTVDDAGTRKPLGSVVEVLFGAGALCRLGELADRLGASRVLLVTDPGIRRAGHADRAMETLTGRARSAAIFDGEIENPTTVTVAAGCAVARVFQPDLLVGLGGGSAMDTAKGINFLVTNGGEMADYWGTNKVARPMLPMIAIPTTTGTGSEAQSYALISDARTHMKMACGDSKALPRYAILDPELAATQPARLVAITGIDAIAHAIETAGCARRNPASLAFARRAWEHLDSSYTLAVRNPADHAVISRMLLGAHFAGCAIEKSMLGAAHAAANPLTAQYRITHGIAVALVLPHVIRFNCSSRPDCYATLSEDGFALADRVDELRRSAGLPLDLAGMSIPHEDLPQLAALAAKQWTARFNPVAMAEGDFLRIYESAFGRQR